MALYTGSHKDTEDLEIFDYLISQGADINEVDQYGNTEIFHACENENMARIERLLELGCKLDLKNKDG